MDYQLCFDQLIERMKQDDQRYTAVSCGTFDRDEEKRVYEICRLFWNQGSSDLNGRGTYVAMSEWEAVRLLNELERLLDVLHWGIKQ